MFDAWRRGVLALLKVPPEPQPPLGEPASLRVFRAGHNYYKLRLATWAATQALALGAFLFWTAILIDVEAAVRDRKLAPAAAPVPADARDGAGAAGAAATPPSGARPSPGNRADRFSDRIRSAATTIAPAKGADKPRGLREWISGYKRFFVEVALLLPAWVFPLLWVAKIGGFLVYLGQIPLTYAVRRLDYELRWYMVTDRSLRLRHGVWKVSESTMSFANVQQVTVTQGPIQRLLGLADLKVQSAGGGSVPPGSKHAGDDMHVGWFRHVTNAPEIRDLILERLRRFRESGIGDPDDASGLAPETSPVVKGAALEAARELLAEARAWRTRLS
jgi:membrane protein YdbS with pleckstrin-like domain